MVTSHRRIFATIVLSVVAASTAACGSGDGAAKPGASTASTGAAATAVPPPTLGSTPSGPAAGKSAARWETVTTLSGSGPTRTARFDILPDAIQWRARYTCETGTLKVNTDPPPRRPAPMVDAACPGEGQGFSIVSGSVLLDIAATGPWKLIVDQQVETPLNEPPLPAMATGRVVREGTFYDVEKTSKGTARLFRLADGRHALRMEDFEVNQNTDLFVWLGSASTPKTSAAAAGSEYWVLGNLKSTLGNQNYEIPANIPIDRVQSIVIWCQPVAIAYGAAGLSPA
ncbi:MAG: DM13 domain-containing protein [Acidimicrobiales bacterium]